MLKTFNTIGNSDFILHLFISSDCDDLINRYIELSNGKIVRYSLVDNEKMLQTMAKADFLISVGNTTPAFKPSKIFEYISMGKPIIHFYSNDLIEGLLNIYPAAIQINQDVLNEKESAKFIENFTIINKNVLINWNDIAMHYPNHSFDKIKKILLTAID